MGSRETDIQVLNKVYTWTVNIYGHLLKITESDSISRVCAGESKEQKVWFLPLGSLSLTQHLVSFSLLIFGGLIMHSRVFITVLTNFQ